MKSILDPRFNYVPAVQTDLRKTFARIRREMEKAKPAAPPSNVQPLQQRRDRKV